MSAVRIGGGLGFYGDNFRPARELITVGHVQYIGFDHLSELTLAILAKDQARDLNLGYARDLVPMLRALWPVAASHGVRLISNAGGLNPVAAARAAAQAARALGMNPRIGVVQGDSVMNRLAAVAWDEPAAGLGPIVFANAYLGALPIKRALAQGANLVITGRVADSALFLGALAHAHDWTLPGEDGGPVRWDVLAKGAVAGHLLECSGQVTGGNHAGDWQHIEGLDRIGYPIAEVGQGGAVTMTKPEGTGGRVTFGTVREQLLYEVHNPAAYYTPDVTVDLTGVDLITRGPDRVEVVGVRGEPPPATYKVLAGHQDGYLGQGLIGFSWPDALEKARAAARILERQVEALGLPREELAAECVGVNSFHGPLAPEPQPGEPNEVYLRMAMRTADREAAEAFSRLFPALALSGPPTASGLLGVDRVRGLVRARAGAVAHLVLDAGVAVRVEPAAAWLADARTTAKGTASEG